MIQAFPGRFLYPISFRHLPLAILKPLISARTCCGRNRERRRSKELPFPSLFSISPAGAHAACAHCSVLGSACGLHSQTPCGLHCQVSIKSKFPLNLEAWAVLARDVYCPSFLCQCRLDGGWHDEFFFLSVFQLFLEVFPTKITLSPDPHLLSQ